MTKKGTKTKSKKSSKQQLKIPNTGRIDANPEIEAQAEVYRKACADRMEQWSVEIAEQEKLTELLKKNGVTEYKYEDDEGVPRRAYIPKGDGPKAKVQKIKPKKADDAA